MRVFIAFPPGDELLSYVTDVQKLLRKKGVEGRYSITSNLHLTAAFLGEVEDVTKIKKILENNPFEGGSITPLGLDLFGDTVVLKADADERVQSCVNKLREELKAKNIYFDGKKFVPHITLVRSSVGINRYEADILSRSLVYKKYNLDTINLYKSEIKGKIRVYTVI